ncbi:MAG: winged helix-turn-helix domain-containing protein [Candidatus Coprovivens sp.]
MDLKIDKDRKSCFIGDKEIILTRVEYNLLNLFVDNKNKVLNRREIANAVWDTKVSDRTVDAVISRLRKKLKGIDLKTRTGFGYGLLE